MPPPLFGPKARAATLFSFNLKGRSDVTSGDVKDGAPVVNSVEIWMAVAG